MSTTWPSPSMTHHRSRIHERDIRASLRPRGWLDQYLGETDEQLVAICGGRERYVPKPVGGVSPSADYVATEADRNLAFMIFNARVVGIKGGAHDLTPTNCTG